MEEIIKLTAVAVVGCICVVLVRQHRPELSLLIQLAGLVSVLIFSIAVMDKITDYCRAFLDEGIVDSGYLKLLYKALGIAVAAKIGGDVCRDSGNSALAFGVELASKAAILLLTLPMLRNLADITSGLLKG